MKKYELLLLSLFFVFSTKSVQASGRSWYEVGNGGDGVMCYSDPESLVPGGYYLLDYFESVYLYNMTPQLQSTSEDPRELARELILRIPNASSSGIEILLNHIDRFFEEASFAPSIYIPAIADSGPATLPKNCDLVQLVVSSCPGQFSIDSVGDRAVYRINEDFWLQMSIEQQAVTIVHEVLYRESALPNFTGVSSAPLRRLIALLISDRAKLLSNADYLKILDSVWILTLRYETEVRKDPACFQRH